LPFTLEERDLVIVAILREVLKIIARQQYIEHIQIFIGIYRQGDDN